MFKFLNADTEQLQYSHEIGFNLSYEYLTVHTHEFWEFAFACQNLFNCSNGQRYSISKNSIFIVRPSDVHYIKADTASNPNKTFTHLNLKISGAALKSLILALWNDEFYESLSQYGKPLIFSLSPQEVLKFQDAMQDLLVSDRLKEKEICFVIKSLITDMLYTFYKNSKQNFGYNIYPESIRSIIEKMNTPEYYSFKLQEILEDSNYSYMQLNRLFTQYTGKTPGAYFSSVKLSYACNLLLYTDIPISDIALKLGFLGTAHFDHIFKNTFHLSPKEYRHMKNRPTQ